MYIIHQYFYISLVVAFFARKQCTQRKAMGQGAGGEVAHWLPKHSRAVAWVGHFASTMNGVNICQHENQQEDWNMLKPVSVVVVDRRPIPTNTETLDIHCNSPKMVVIAATTEWTIFSQAAFAIRCDPVNLCAQEHNASAKFHFRAKKVLGCKLLTAAFSVTP